MDPFILGGIALLLICLLVVFVIRKRNTLANSQPLPQNTGTLDGDQKGNPREEPLPWFDPQPRRDTIFAAGRYRWKLKIVYYSNDGSVNHVTCPAPQTSGIPRQKIASINLTTSDGEKIPLHRIRCIEVLAASEETRERYRVRDTVSDKVLRSWREAIESAIATQEAVAITYQDEQGDVSERTIRPIKLLNANSRPKVRAHCQRANDERHFLLERILDLRIIRTSSKLAKEA